MDSGEKFFVGEGHEVSWWPRKKASSQLFPKKHKNWKPPLPINAVKSWRQAKARGSVQFSKKYQNNIVAYILWGV